MPLNMISSELADSYWKARITEMTAKAKGVKKRMSESKIFYRELAVDSAPDGASRKVKISFSSESRCAALTGAMANGMTKFWGMKQAMLTWQGCKRLVLPCLTMIAIRL